MVFSRKHLIDLSIKAHHFKGMNISITWHFITTFLFFYVLARTKSAPLSSLLCRFLTFTNRLTKYFKPFLSIEYICFTSYNFSWEHFSSSRIFVKHRKLTLTETASYLKSYLLQHVSSWQSICILKHMQCFHGLRRFWTPQKQHQCFPAP